MRGVCSITGCEYVKIHEDFEGVEGINICWNCGNKILKGLKEENNE
jgi:hypothetical protein